MNILFISRATLFTNKGGDTIQITRTASELKKLGVHTDIRLSNETIDYSAYDLIHFFNIIRPADIMNHVRLSRKPYVVSPIFVDYGEYDKTIRKGLSGKLFKLFSPDFIEYGKVIARSLVNGEKIMSQQYIWSGHSKSVKQVIRHAKMLLPNSENEYRRLTNRYNESKEFHVIPNGIDTGIFGKRTSGIIRNNKSILCVGRFEGLKNQLSLIKALNNTEFNLILVGKPSTNQAKYFEQCRKNAANNVSFIYDLTQEQLVDYYQQAYVHVLPSWFETTGLSSLEAAASGCNVVITDKGDTREYFSDLAFYCDPASPQSIFDAVKKASESPIDEALRNRILSNYTWPITAQRTLQAYQKII